MLGQDAQQADCLVSMRPADGEGGRGAGAAALGARRSCALLLTTSSAGATTFLRQDPGAGSVFCCADRQLLLPADTTGGSERNLQQTSRLSENCI